MTEQHNEKKNTEYLQYSFVLKVQSAGQRETSNGGKMEIARIGYHNVKCQVPETEELRPWKEWEGK